MGISRAGRVGIVLLFGTVFLYAGLKFWVVRRNFNPVDTPVQLTTGSVLQQKFSVNYESDYWVDLVARQHEWNNTIALEEEQLRYRVAILDAQGNEIPSYSWRAEPDGSIRGLVGCAVHLNSGEYTVRFAVLNGAPTLAKMQPHMQISTSGDFPNFLVAASGWAALFATYATAMYLLRRAFVSRSQNHSEEKSFSAPPTGSYPATAILAHIREDLRLKRKSRWSVSAHWSLFTAIFLTALFFPIWFLYEGDRIPAQGEWVMTRTPARAVVPSLHPKLVLQVVCANRKGEVQYLVDDYSVKLDALQSELKPRLAVLPEPVVYLDGDPDCTYGKVAAVVGIVSNLNARTVLLTPKLRALMSLNEQRAAR